MNKFRVLALLLCVVLVGSVLGACTGSTTPTAAPTTGTATAAPTTGATTETATPDEGNADKASLPFEETVAITYWQVFGTKYASEISSFEDMLFFKWVEEQINVDFQWQEPSEGTETEQFGLMIASRAWPDIIQGLNKYYAGGVAAGYDDGIVLPIDDYMEEYMPNLSYFYSEFPEWEVQALYEDGLHLTIPYFRNDANLYNSGLMIRTDILDANGLAVPETIDEFDALLYSFKEIGVKIPFSILGIKPILNDTIISSAWNVKNVEYQDGATHTVKFGAVEPEFKAQLEMYARWYADGVIDPDFISNDSNSQNAKVAEGNVGVWYAAGGGGGVTPWQAAVDNNPDTEMYVVGIKGLVGEKGTQPKTVARSDGNYQADQSAIVTTTCKDVGNTLLAMDFMGYSQEGIRALMYGVEGIDYTVEPDGRLMTYVDENGTGVAMAKQEKDPSKSRWTPNWTTTSGPYISGIINYDDHTVVHQGVESVMVQRWYNPDDTSVGTKKNIYSDTRRAVWIENWMDGDFVNNLPPIIYTAEMSANRADIYPTVETYVLEQIAAFITGERSLDEFDAYVQSVWDMGLQTILDDTQALVTEYYSR